MLSDRYCAREGSRSEVGMAAGLVRTGTSQLGEWPGQRAGSGLMAASCAV